jgi:tRNA1(Val) A37 N6-methylase TrmN6
LDEKGSFYLVIPVQHADEIGEMLRMDGFFLNRKMLVTGREGSDPNRVLMCWGRKEEEIQVSGLTMYKADTSPTEEYIDFTRGYYLWKKIDKLENLKW